MADRLPELRVVNDDFLELSRLNLLVCRIVGHTKRLHTHVSRQDGVPDCLARRGQLAAKSDICRQFSAEDAVLRRECHRDGFCLTRLLQM